MVEIFDTETKNIYNMVSFYMNGISEYGNYLCLIKKFDNEVTDAVVEKIFSEKPQLEYLLNRIKQLE